VRIDRAVAAGNVAPVAGRADDATFVRRIHLDLVGRIPTSAETRAFLADADPQKRAKLIDTLLASPESARYLAVAFDVWLMERRGETHVKSDLWRTYLTDSFLANKPYDQLVREILAADGTEELNRAASRFYLDRLGEPHLLTRDVGRLFFGTDLQCAQCHDHPTITDYRQRDYYGMYAFFNRTELFRPDTKLPGVLAEKAIGEADFQSVFTQVKGTSLPQILESTQRISDPTFKPGEEYKVKPDPKNKNLKPVPNYSRRAKIGAAAADGTNVAFNRNIANRLWAHLMGRGLVEPFDFTHSANPPVHPELLDLLGREFAAMKFDIRAFLREVALSETYQRKFELPENLVELAATVRPKMDALEAEVKARTAQAEKSALAFNGQKETWEEAKRAFSPKTDALAAAIKQRDESREPSQAAAKVHAEAAAKLQPQKDFLTRLEAAANLAGQMSAPADKALAAKLKAQVNQLKPAVAKLQAEADKAKKLADPLVAKFTEGEATATKLTAELGPETAKLDAQEADLQKALDRFQSDKAAARYAERLRDDAKTLLAYTDTLGELKSAQSAVAGAGKNPEKLAAAQTALYKLEERRDAQLQELSARWTASFATGVFAPMTPEHLMASIQTAGGERARLKSLGEADFTKRLAAQQKALAEKKPVKDAILKEADRARAVMEYVDTQSKGATTRFVQLFGGQPGQPQTDFYATADQALFFANDSIVRGWLRPVTNDALTARLAKLTDPVAIAEELYLSVLSRMPEPAEKSRVADYLALRPDQKPIAVQELAWSLVCSTEFRFRH